MSIWTDFGFRESPYATEPIPATSEGDRLLVGREAELRRLTNSLTSSALHPTIEGDNGVGKTSLVAVAGFRLKTAFEARETGQALFPLPMTFQLSGTDTPSAFAAKVYYAVAQAFIEHGATLRAGGINTPNTAAVDRWLNSPVFRSGGVGVSVLGNGGEVSRGSEPNTSEGFTAAGFESKVIGWLREAFPSRQSGGFICVIDNLELLETSQAARVLLESMRDGVLALPGLRWVLCGARGIVRTSASSQRLEGRLAEPMDLLPISDEQITQVIDRRVEVFGISDNTIAPVGPDGFRHIYDVLNRNLRNAFKYCEDFAFWLHDSAEDHSNADTNLSLLEAWLTTRADASHDQTSLGGRAWGVLDGIAERGGSISPSDYADFDFKDMPTMRPHVKALEDAQIVSSTVDESDRRRRTIVMTARGWLVRYKRSGYRMPHEYR